MRPAGQDELLIKALMPLFLQGFLLVILEKMALIEPIVSDDGSVTTKVLIIITIAEFLKKCVAILQLCQACNE